MTERNEYPESKKEKCGHCGDEFPDYELEEGLCTDCKVAEETSD